MSRATDDDVPLLFVDRSAAAGSVTGPRSVDFRWAADWRAEVAV